MKKAGTCDLKTCFLCQFSIPEWIAAVSDHKQHLFFKKNEIIFREGEPVEGIYFLYSGGVKIHKQWGDGKDLIVRFARRGDLFGHRGLGSGERLYTVTATAQEDTTVCYTNLSFFEASLKVNPELTLKLMQFYADELQEAERKMRNLVHMDVKGRLADALLELSRLHKAPQFSISRQDLASFAGTTYETIYRNLQEFIQEKLIAVDGRSITILHDKKLRKYIH